jgi:hypothetical protein
MFASQGREYLLNGRRNDLTRICPYGRGNDRNSSERRVVDTVITTTSVASGNVAFRYSRAAVPLT